MARGLGLPAHEEPVGPRRRPPAGAYGEVPVSLSLVRRHAALSRYDNTKRVGKVKAYVYRMNGDEGYAPNNEDGILTLALCKPRIRSRARAGDLVVGIAGRTMRNAPRVAWAGVVYQSDSRYHSRRNYRHRTDAIYRVKSGKLVHKAGKVTIHRTQEDHKEQQRQDKSAPVLVFNRYFRAPTMNQGNRAFPADFLGTVPIPGIDDNGARGHRSTEITTAQRDAFMVALV